MTAKLLTRRPFLLATLLALPATLVGCGEEAPASYPEPSYDHLVTLNLNVGRIDIDDRWAPRGASRRMEFLAPVTPRTALRRMAQDRLVAGGTAGRAVFVIDDASIIRAPQHYEGRFEVRLDLADDSGNRLGQATARVTQLRPVGEENERAVRDDLYAFVRDLMSEMNVEFEFQIRRMMREALQTTSPGVPDAAPVEAQPLDQPQGQPQTSPTRSPPPGNLVPPTRLQ